MSSTLAPSSRRETSTAPEYERDVCAWSREQARLIRERRSDELDIENVAEEIESVGRSERSALISYLARVTQHLLTWEHRPDRRGPSRSTSIRVHRVHAARILRQNPGLKGHLDEILDDAYRLAILYAAEEIGIDPSELPPRNPFTLDVLLPEAEPAS